MVFNGSQENAEHNILTRFGRICHLNSIGEIFVLQVRYPRLSKIKIENVEKFYNELYDSDLIILGPESNLKSPVLDLIRRYFLASLRARV